MHRVPFVSQHVYAFSTVSCGVAATLMLLKFHSRRRRVPSYRELRHELGIYVNPTKSHLLGVGPDEITAFLTRQRLAYRQTHQNTRRTRAILSGRLESAPIMVGMGGRPRWGACGHWIVLIGVTDAVVTFLDPGRPPHRPRPSSIPWREFRREWDGSSIQITKFY